MPIRGNISAKPCGLPATSASSVPDLVEVRLAPETEPTKYFPATPEADANRARGCLRLLYREFDVLVTMTAQYALQCDTTRY